MTVPFEGGCLCGAVRYRVTKEPLGVVVCHCKNCQKQTASDRSPVVFVPVEGLEFTKGETKTLRVQAESGNMQSRHFCGDCGSPIMTQPDHRPEIRTLKAGSIDDPSWLKPTAHIWVSSAPAYAAIPDDLPHHAGNLPPPNTAPK